MPDRDAVDDGSELSNGPPVPGRPVAIVPSGLQPSSRSSVAAYSSAKSLPFEPTDVDSYNYVIKQLNYRKRFSLVRDVYEDMLLDGVQPLRDTFYLLITGAMQTVRLQDVMFFFDEMKAMGITPDVAMYNCIIAACGRSQQVDRAFQVAEEMEAFGVQPKHRTFLALLRACAFVGRVEEAYGVVRRMATHGFTLDKHCYAALITAHANKMPRSPDTVEKILEVLEQSKVPQAEDNMAVAATGEIEPRDDVEEGFLNFLQKDDALVRRGFVNRRLTVYHAAISAFQDLGNREAVKKVLHMIEKDGHGIDAYSTVQLIKCYISEGDFQKACLEYNKFLEMGRRPTIELYQILIDGAITHPSPANSAVAQKLLAELVQKSFFLNSKAGGEILSKACQDKTRDVAVANIIWDMMQARQVRLPMKVIMDYYKALDRSGTPKDDPRMATLVALLDDSRRYASGAPDSKINVPSAEPDTEQETSASEQVVAQEASEEPAVAVEEGPGAEEPTAQIEDASEAGTPQAVQQ
ncbi:hypothetical protein AXG93_3569s1080 [Marchantia polymorpha subsp. ruderalis]|uniref:PROP1-like PPR domain-containing protein n=1 Tax=Marchantia polymorpha subsp. ruderalis TaxID=1480154 RepID=A0A176WIZ8_MARPO|nr:hypothetical protein AXG93_3569s1080 [Marchantia polymorpha subsp. ruderalis]